MNRGKHARLQSWAGTARLRPKVLGGLAAGVGAVVLGASLVISAQGAGAATASHSVPGAGPAHATVRAQLGPQASAATSGLTPFATVTGKVYMSEDAIGTNNPAGGPVLVQKRDASATVEAAYLLAAGVPDYTIQNGDITLNGTSLSFPAANSAVNNLANAGAINSVWTNVTSIVKPVVDAAAAGNVSFTAAEGQATGNIDGEILAVIMQDPTLPSDNTVSFEFGALNATGDTYSLGLAQPLNLSNKNLALTMSIGDSYGYQGPPATGQYSDISVNGTKLTSSAGGNDDSICKLDNPQDFQNCGNGELITVGGIGDSTANPPDPNATDSTCAGGPPRCDDELYNLLPFVHNGDTSIKVNTDNPSLNDNIFFTGFELDSAVAVVGEGATLSPASGTAVVGSPYTLTAKVQDSNGNPVASQAVTFTVLSGPDAGVHQAATTDSTGSASFTYSGASAGEDVVQVSFTDANGNKEVSNTATVNWTLAALPTTLTTSLSGAGKTGTAITVPAGTAVADSATLSGTNAAKATGTVTYNVYSDSACTKLVKGGAAEKISTAGALPKSAAVTLAAASTYYWTASYSGDATNKPSVSKCGSEKLTVMPLPATDTMTTAVGKSSATARVTTTVAGDLLVALVAGRGPSGAQAATVSGGGVTWHLAGRENAGRGDVEVWTATAGGVLNGVSVKATAKTSGFTVTMTVVAVKHAAAAGALAKAEAASGAPKATLKTAHNDGWVLAMADDSAHAVTPKPAAGQFVVSRVADSTDTLWAQATSQLVVTAGTPVTISDSWPIADPWDLIVVEVY